VVGSAARRKQLMATEQEAKREEAMQLIKIQNTKRHLEKAEEVDGTKVQEWAQLVICEQLIRIRYVLEQLRDIEARNAVRGK
jgi:hypothetical protein